MADPGGWGVGVGGGGDRGDHQRRSQVSLAGGGGLTEFRGGGINLNTYSYGKRDRQPRGGCSNFSRGGGLSPPSPPPWLRAW